MPGNSTSDYWMSLSIRHGFTCGLPVQSAARQRGLPRRESAPGKRVARALIDADISVDSYSLEKITDPLVTRLMERTTVIEDPVLTQLFPKHLANRVIVKLRSGEELVSEVVTGPGSVETPMTEADFENKFRKMAAAHLGKGAQQGVLAFVSTLDQQVGYDALFAAMAGQGN